MSAPWTTEPDRVEFEAHGLPCLIVRHPRMGHLCGYVAVSPGHPWHGKDLSTVYDEACSPNVHGGITYASKCTDTICHMPKPGEPDDVWWLGFDAAHSGDFSPMTELRRSNNPALVSRFTREPSPHETYKTIEYMRAECESLAQQARAAEGRK